MHSKLLLFFVILLLGIYPCVSFGTSTDAAKIEAAASIHPEKAFDWEGMNLTVSPSDNFYEYAVGNWIATTEIPEGKPRWGTFGIINQSNIERIQSIFEEGFVPQTHSEKILSAFFQSYLNISQQTQEGLQPLKQLLEKIDEIDSRDSLINTIGYLHAQGIPVLFYLGVGAHPYENTRNILYFGQGALNLSDYEVYLEQYDSESNRHALYREEYLSYLEKIFFLSGKTPEEAKRNALKVFSLEKKLAGHFHTKEEARDVELCTNLYSFEQLKSAIPLQYEQIFAQIGISPSECNLMNPAFIQAAANIIDEKDPGALKSYITFTCINHFAPFLGQNFYDAHFQLYSRVMNGIEHSRPINERAIESAGACLGDALGKIYVRKFFSPEKKEEVERMITLAKEAFYRRIAKLDWMEEATKEKAIEKVEKMIVQVGYPDDEHWIDYTSLSTVHQERPLASNMLDIFAFLAKRHWNELEKKVDKQQWPWPAQTVNACNCPDMNKINFPAGILQAPMLTDDPAVSWGAFGMVICHEMIHSFDDQGCKYDADGNNSNWWQESDMARFQAHAEVIKEQFNRYSLHFADGSEEFIRGGLCLGENIADLGGINIAYAAFEDFLKENPLPDVFGFTPQQRFFLGYAQVWRNKETDAYRKVALNNDPHSPPVFRVNGTLSQLPEFARAFHLPKKCPMVISEDKHSRMWNTD